MKRAMTHFLQHIRWDRPRAHTDAAQTSWNSAPLAGTHLVTPRHGYNHHGIYLGDGKVMHYAGLCGSLHSASVEEVSIAHFAAGHVIWIKPTPFPKYVG